MTLQRTDARSRLQRAQADLARQEAFDRELRRARLRRTARLRAQERAFLAQHRGSPGPTLLELTVYRAIAQALRERAYWRWPWNCW